MVFLGREVAMALESVWLDDELILYVDDVFDSARCPAATRLVQRAMDSGVRSVIVDLVTTRTVDEDGVAALAAAAAACRNRGARMALALSGDLSVQVRNPAEVRTVLHQGGNRRRLC
jgi:anti-anti-sigma regulatory factor